MDTGGFEPLDWERRHWRRIETLFAAAEALPESERDAFLSAECGDDDRLRDRVRALLDAELDAADQVGELVSGLSPLASARAGAAGEGGGVDEAVPDRIGPYEVLREVGRGGSSSVFLAERADGAFRKKVALKLVRRGLDTQAWGTGRWLLALQFRGPHHCVQGNELE